MQEKRYQEILRIVRARNCVSIDTLAKELHISPSTVRRDLAEFNRRELVQYNKNGVIPMYEMHLDPMLHFRTQQNVAAKEAIGRCAASSVKSDGVIFLDASSTALYLADALRGHKGLVVLTNSLPIVARLRGKGIRVILIGGTLSERSHAFYGPMTEAMLNHYNIDMAFISPAAITPDGDVAEVSRHAAEVRRSVLRRTRCSILMCDASKIGLTRPYNIGHLNDFNFIVTDDASNLCETTAVVLQA